MANTVEQNKAHFNDIAKDYEEKHGKAFEELINHVRSLKDFIGADWVSEDDEKPTREVRLLDYACGTGLISRALLPYITSAIGIDITENMISLYNSRAQNQGLSESEMHAYQGDICTPPRPPPDPSSSTSPTDPFPDAKFYAFDIAAVGLGFHHFESPSYAALQLSRRLKPGGVLFIVDFLPHDEMAHGHAAKHTVMHHGFSEDEIRTIFAGAGCGKDFAMTELGHGVVFDRLGEDRKNVKRHVFLARGTKD